MQQFLRNLSNGQTEDGRPRHDNSSGDSQAELTKLWDSNTMNAML